MTETQMNNRTKQFALRVLKLAEALPRSISADVIQRQIVRSATSVASGYRAACRAKSTNDFIYKLRIVEEEADETALWLELISESGMLPEPRLSELLEEANAITAIVVSSQKTTKSRARSRNRNSKIENPE